MLRRVRSEWAAIEECIRRGMTVTTLTDDGMRVRDNSAHFIRYTEPIVGQHLYPNDRSCLKFRTHPVLADVVEEMGESENGDCAQLKVIDIPFSGTEGWEIDEYDGIEKVEQTHQSWG